MLLEYPVIFAVFFGGAVTETQACRLQFFEISMFGILLYDLPFTFVVVQVGLTGMLLGLDRVPAPMCLEASN